MGKNIKYRNRNIRRSISNREKIRSIGEEDKMNYPTIEICSPDGKAMYITIDGYIFYIDNTTNEQIMECWKDDGTDEANEHISNINKKRVLVR